MGYPALNLCLCGLLLAASADLGAAQTQPCAPAGSPGTPTPTPYASPSQPGVARPPPAPFYRPPLLRTIEPPPPRDQSIPLLEQQLRRNSENPGRAPGGGPAQPQGRRR